MHPTSLEKMKAFVEGYLQGYKEYPLVILDVGSQAVEGMATYRQFFNNPKWQYLRLDMVSGENVDIVVKDPYRWDEIEDSSIDVVISGQAFEHIEYPWLTIKEIFRVLKDKGLACIITPSAGPEHKYPFDCWRIYPDGMKALGKWAGFRIIEVFTDWGLLPWQDTFAVFQKPLTGASRIAPFEEFSSKEVALKVYIEAFKDKPQNPVYYGVAVDILKSRKELKKAQIYMATALGMFPHNLWLRQRAVELYLETDPVLALESVIFLLKARPITQENVKLIGRFWEKVDPTLRELLYEQLPAEVNQLAQIAHIAEREKLYVLAEDCWKKISSLQPNNLHARLMFAVMPRGYGDIEESKKRFEEALNYQLSNKILNRTTIIQHLINRFGYKTYIEIGVERGLNFFQIRAPLKIGVDPNFVILGELTNTETEKFYKLTSDEFFANPPKEIVENGIDIAFIDGLHTYEQSLRDVENCLKYLNPNGIIVMHDCLPSSEAEAMPSLEEAKKHPEFKGAWTGDVYKTIIHLRATRPDLFVAVVDVDYGVGIVKPGEPENVLDLSLEEIRNLTFKDLVKNKEHLLNLKPGEWFWNIIAQGSTPQ